MYHIIMLFLWLIGLFPFWFIYWLSDLLYYLCYYIIAYRKAVVFNNIRNSFPQHSEEEIKVIAKQFYHNFCDVLVEYIKLLSLSEGQVRRMVEFRNGELLEELRHNKRGVLILQGHFLNWELSLMLGPQISKSKRHVVYKKLSSNNFEKIIHKLRTKFGTNMLTMHETLDFIRNNEADSTAEHGLYHFGADQAPMMHKIEYWGSFLNQETPFFTGPENIAKELNIPVVYLDLQRVSRGKYLIEYRMVEENPANTEKYELTDKYISLLEEAINKNPANYLWSHKRWKNKRS
ncbi:MAG TPA: lipid A biosynthesis acyltransferase [Flavobacteriales bacterium]|nr:lipid A biosynthesis acyltransferase [Flavobacteriales bacterium]HIN39108.1 lipid A biosynthesis acyltransferase [Flavobacteriales bacterium]